MTCWRLQYPFAVPLVCVVWPRVWVLRLNSHSGFILNPPTVSRAVTLACPGLRWFFTQWMARLWNLWKSLYEAPRICTLWQIDEFLKYRAREDYDRSVALVIHFALLIWFEVGGLSSCHSRFVFEHESVVKKKFSSVFLALTLVCWSSVFLVLTLVCWSSVFLALTLVYLK